MKTEKPQRNRQKQPLQEYSVAIIGAGRMGTALGIALANTGYRIDLIASLHSASARRAARLIDKRATAVSLDDLEKRASRYADRLADVQLVLIATPDDAIESVALRLARIYKTPRLRNKQKTLRRVVLHTSGAIDSTVLVAMKKQGFNTGSLHPLVSISGSKNALRKLAGAFFKIDGDRPAVRLGKQIARDLGGQAFKIHADKSALYHAGAVMASPNLTALFDISIQMLAACGLSPRQAREILLPLVRSTVDNLSQQDTADALTGTFKRGDVETIRRHLAAIESSRVEDALEVYLLLGHHSMTLTDIPARRKWQIKQLLARAANKTRQRAA